MTCTSARLHDRHHATACALSRVSALLLQAERSAPADGPLKASRLPVGFVRRHLKIAPYKAMDFATERAAAWRAILDG